MISNEKFDKWIKHNLNVLLVGEKGIGKTSMMLEALRRNNLKWRYFSAATLDPWTDVIGIPREAKDGNGKSYIEYIQPKYFAEDEVEVIVFDELNRCKSKISNSVLELIQFKSINGKKFNNLRMVWAAINPDTKDQDGELNYNVEKLDPALEDRFQVKVILPYMIDEGYFAKKYGSGIAKAACNWWRAIDSKQKHLVSPRRLEYAIDMFLVKVDLGDILPREVNISLLTKELNSGSRFAKMHDIFKRKEIDEAKEFINNEENFSAVESLITKNSDYIKFFLPIIKQEKFFKLLTNNSVSTTICSNKEIFKEQIEAILAYPSGSGTIESLKKILAPKNPTISTNLSPSLPPSKPTTAIDPLILGFINQCKSLTSKRSEELRAEYSIDITNNGYIYTPDLSISLGGTLVWPTIEDGEFRTKYGAITNTTQGRAAYHGAFDSILSKIPAQFTTENDAGLAFNTLVTCLNHYHEKVLSRTYSYIGKGSIFFVLYLGKKIAEVLATNLVNAKHTQNIIDARVFIRSIERFFNHTGHRINIDKTLQTSLSVI